MSSTLDYNLKAQLIKIPNTEKFHFPVNIREDVIQESSPGSETPEDDIKPKLKKDFKNGLHDSFIHRGPFCGICLASFVHIMVENIEDGKERPPRAVVSLLLSQYPSCYRHTCTAPIRA